MYRLTTALITLSATLFTTLATPTQFNGVVTAPLKRQSTYTGQGTWYEVGLGACGYDDTDSESIVAISAQIYGSGGYCNQTVYITNTDNGQTATGEVRDECESCDSGSLDMSPSLFEQLSTLDTGVIPISWYFE
ncbi:barwin-like endoglucanase [Rhizopogon salebrosus TDB-379]|nr:barwin-like endoglucanase [Rhizopogon salebrosus TDB-379]